MQLPYLSPSIDSVDKRHKHRGKVRSHFSYVPRCYVYKKHVVGLTFAFKMFKRAYALALLLTFDEVLSLGEPPVFLLFGILFYKGLARSY